LYENGQNSFSIYQNNAMHAEFPAVTNSSSTKSIEAKGTAIERYK